MIHGIIGVISVVLIMFISAKKYDHSGRNYAAGKESVPSIDHFRYVYRYIQVTSIAAAILSYIYSFELLFKVHNNIYLLYAGLAVAYLGILLFLFSKKALHDQYSPCFDMHSPERIIKEGPYRYIRHPIYTANIILLSGFFISSGSLWVAFNVVLLLVYYRKSAAMEEAHLRSAFAEYSEYAGNTGMFIPRIKRVLT